MSFAIDTSPLYSGVATWSDKPKRLLMTVDAVGGVWRYAMELGQALRSQGFRILFAGLGPKPKQDQEAAATGIGDLIWLNQPLDWLVRNEAELRHVQPALAELVDAFDVDLVHLNLPSQAAGLDVPVPIVVTSHSCVASWWAVMRGGSLPEELLWQERLNSAGLETADAVVCPSGSHARQIQKCYGLQPHLSVVYNGISAFLSCDTKEDFAFATGRWWDEGKNGAVIDAAAPLIDWPVIMAGATRSPSGNGAMISNARALGEIPHHDILDHARRSSIFVSASLYEPFGLAALEGARAGCALVLSDIPTYRELWHGAALFFDPRSAEDLADKVNSLARDPDLRHQMGMRALARSRCYMPHLQASEMAEIYNHLIDRTPATMAEGA